LDSHPAIGSETVIDIHCHVMSEGAEALARNSFAPERDPFIRYLGGSEVRNRELFELIRPKLVDPRSRLDDMDRMGVDVQAISVAPPQYFYWAEPSVGAAAARITNDRIAAIVSAHPDRFVGLGTVPLQDVDAALSELDRMTSELGFRGVEICTQVNGLDLDDVRFEPFFAEIVERDLLLVVHPNGTTQGERLTEYYLINVVGMPLDSTIFIAKMIFGGVLASHPRLKMVVVHGGGYAASYPARFDHAYLVRPESRVNIDRAPSEYLSRLYFDTVVYDVRSLSTLVGRYGADHIVLGTDYPYDMAESDPVGLVRSLEASPEEHAMILGRNAAGLLGSPVSSARRTEANGP
jgi:aminocarboxymuconate-semialdehyde decarboxylase